MTTWKIWADEMVRRIADAVKARRLTLGLTAAELSDRTKCGKQLSRAVISDLETGRKRTLEVSEWLTLAVALEIPPPLLLFPGYPDEPVEVMPGQEVSSRQAFDWITGISDFPSKTHSDVTVEIVGDGRSQPGIDLIAAVRERQKNEEEIFFREINSKSDAPPEIMAMNVRIFHFMKDRLAKLPREIERARESLWGNSSDA